MYFKNKLYNRLNRGMESRLELVALKYDVEYPKVYRDYIGRKQRLEQAYYFEYANRPSHILAKAFRGTEQTFKRQYDIRNYRK